MANYRKRIADEVLSDLNTMDLLFEALCMRDLRVNAMVEIKLGGDNLISEGKKTLKSLAGIIDTSRMPAPSFSMVLTGVGDYAYRDEDGIYIVPIGCLKN